jgi:carboxymethylenebutenolidase
MIQLTASDGTQVGAYEVAPDDASASVVVIQEIFGVNAHIRSVVDRYASYGYRSIAPALFDRIEPGIELEYDEAGIARGRELAGQLHRELLMADVAAAVAHVGEACPVAVVGYCLGGSIAWQSASRLPISAAVGYYGGQIPELVDETPAVPTMLHFGAEDHAIPLDGVRKVADAHPEVPVHVYDGAGHGFNCDARASYHPLSAAIAQGRTLEFLVANGVRP